MHNSLNRFEKHTLEKKVPGRNAKKRLSTAYPIFRRNISNSHVTSSQAIDVKIIQK